MSLLDKASLVITPNAVKAGKLYSVIPNTTLGDMDVVRATTATRVNFAGLIPTMGINFPRLDYTNGSCPSILCEPQRTNIFLNSNNANSWDKIATTITPNSINAPNGVLEGSLVTATPATSTAHLFYRNISFNLAAYSFGCFFKKANTDLVQINMGSQFGNCYANFNLTSGTVVKVIGCTAGVTSFSNGWYYCYIISPTPTILGVQSFIFSLINTPLANQNPQFTSAGESVYAWGAQLEQGSYPTSYIPTLASTVTRNADVISKTGISSLIDSQQGVLFADLQFLTGIGNIRSINISNGSNNNRIGFYGHPSIADRITFAISSGGVTTDINFNGVTLTNRNKILIRYSGTTFTSFVNGVKSANQTFTPFTANFLNRIGLDYGEDILRYEGRINSIQVYKTALTDQECINLTTL